MLELNTRYVLRNPENIEKIIVINNAQDQAYYSKYVGQEGYSFTPIKVSTAPDSTCVSCEG